MKLKEVVNAMKQIDAEILAGQKAMMQLNSLGVDAVRGFVNELQSIRESLYNEPMISDRSLEHFMAKYRDCIRQCLRPSYAKKGQDLDTPIPDIWIEELPVTVTAVHLIVYIDMSASMFEYGGFKSGGTKRKLVQDFANKIKERLDKEAETGNVIPFKVSLVGYADPTATGKVNLDSNGAYWKVPLRKSDDVAGLSGAIGSINRSGWAQGLSQLEEGLTCIHKTIDALHVPDVVNGKPTENIVLLISDERQRASNVTGSHKNYKQTVSTTALKNKLNGLGIKNVFGLLPFSKGYNYSGYTVNTSSPTKTVSWNSGIRNVFRSTKEYWNTTTLSQMDNWVRWILAPDKFGT